MFEVVQRPVITNHKTNNRDLILNPYPTTAADKCLSMDHIIARIFSFLQHPDPSDDASHNRQRDLISFIQVNRQFRDHAKKLVYQGVKSHISNIKSLNESLTSKTFHRGVDKETALFVRSLRLVIDSGLEFKRYFADEMRSEMELLFKKLGESGALKNLVITGHQRFRSRFISDYVCGDIAHWKGLKIRSYVKSLDTVRLAAVVTSETFSDLVRNIRQIIFGLH